MTATVIEVRTGREKHARPDEHVQFPDIHPDEPLLTERGACGFRGEPSWWLDASPSNQANRQKAKTICLNECPVLDECRRVTDHMERNTTNLNHRLTAEFRTEKALATVRAGEGPTERARRRREEAKEGA